MRSHLKFVIFLFYRVNITGGTSFNYSTIFFLEKYSDVSVTIIFQTYKNISLSCSECFVNWIYKIGHIIYIYNKLIFLEILILQKVLNLSFLYINKMRVEHNNLFNNHSNIIKSSFY